MLAVTNQAFTATHPSALAPRSMKRQLRLPAVLLALGGGCSVFTDGSSTKWTFEVATAGSGSGTVSLSPPGGEYAHGVMVTMTAIPAQGSVFTGWDAPADAPAACLQPVNPCSVSMTTRRSTIATFVPATGVARFDGAYFGPHFNSTGSSPPGAIQLTIANGTLQGTIAAILTPSPGTITGSVAVDGTVTATAPNNIGGICGNTTVGFSGQIATALVDGVTVATITGSFATQGSQPQGCSVSGSWAPKRRTVPKEATGV